MDKIWNKPKYLNNIFDFKSNRREILLSSINDFFNIDKGIFNKISESFECLHFSATTVDDVLDNETFRNNQPCYYVREDYGKSFVASFSSFIRFLELSSCLNALDANVISYIRDMIISEEADCGLRIREKEYTPFRWYFDVCSIKSSNEILAMIQIMNNYRSNNYIAVIKNLFFEIGRYAQMHNDKRDLFTNKPLARFSKSDKVKLTYSLPLAIYFDEIDNSYESTVGKYIEQDEFMIIHNKMSSEFIQKKVTKIIEEQHLRIENIFNEYPYLKKINTFKLFSKISDEQFYKSYKHEIFSK